MKRTHFKLLILFLSLSFMSFNLPQGWFAAGSKPKSYLMGVDKRAGEDGKNTATIQSKDKKIDGFGTLMQDCSPEKYLGKRIRLSGSLKCENVEEWCGLWMRVDVCNSNSLAAFDNMADRRISGSTSWEKYEIVLDVSPDANNIAYGALLNGTGKVWFDNLKIEIVDSTVATTGRKMEPVRKPKPDPVNLDFEK